MGLDIDLNMEVEECDAHIDKVRIEEIIIDVEDSDTHIDEVHVEENLINVNEHVSEQDDISEPHIGMEFVSHEVAKSFYMKYAKAVGFAVCTKHSRRSKVSKEFISAKFACNRCGTKQSNEASNPRPCLKIDCEATLNVKRKNDGKWVVKDFVKDHNHELFPEYAHYYPCYRSISSIDKSNASDLHEVGVKPSKIYAALAKKRGGYGNVGFTEKDLRNHFDKERRLELELGDANAMHELFMKMQEENPNFFYALDLDENNRLKNVFWVDAKGREDYKIFGDVVSFDTTYLTNKYKMPFAPFIGVNNHFQSTLLGCALLADETTSTFVWLMKTWLRAMGGRPPISILTDQDKAMKAAIAEVFPNSRHRFCLWHILQKLPQKLSHVLNEHDDFMDIFNKCIYHTWTCEEFERDWFQMLEKFNLQTNEWLESLFEDRSYWVPTYMRNTFFGGMSTTQRSESINSFFDKYVNKKTTLKEFVGQYNVALQDRHEKEIQADFRTWHTKPVKKSPSPYERKMAKVYTHEVFKKFQVEVLGASGCYPVKAREDDLIALFKVQDFQEKYDFVVEWDESKCEIGCGCRLFEYSGFLCRHAISVIASMGIFDIPSQYILERWTKNFKSLYSNDGKNEVNKDVQYKKERFDKLLQEAIELSKEGSISQESYEIAYRGLKETLRKCAIENKSLKGVECMQDDILDPAIVKTKGAPKKTAKHGMDKNKRRRCNKSKEEHTISVNETFGISQTTPRSLQDMESEAPLQQTNQTSSMFLDLDFDAQSTYDFMNVGCKIHTGQKKGD